MVDAGERDDDRAARRHVETAGVAGALPRLAERVHVGPVVELLAPARAESTLSQRRSLDISIPQWTSF